MACIQTILVSSFSKDSSAYIVKQFYNVLRIQFTIAAIFRKNFGSIYGSTQDVRGALSCVKIAGYEEDDSLVDIELSCLRKLAASVAIAKSGE